MEYFFSSLLDGSNCYCSPLLRRQRDIMCRLWVALVLAMINQIIIRSRVNGFLREILIVINLCLKQPKQLST